MRISEKEETELCVDLVGDWIMDIILTIAENTRCLISYHYFQLLFFFSSFFFRLVMVKYWFYDFSVPLTRLNQYEIFLR